MYILKVVLVMKSSRWLAHLCAENPWYIFPDWKFRCYSLWNCLLYSCDRSMGVWRVWGVWSNLFAHACLLLDTCLQCTSSNPLSQNYFMSLPQITLTYKNYFGHKSWNYPCQPHHFFERWQKQEVTTRWSCTRKKKTNRGQMRWKWCVIRHKLC